MHRNCVAVWFFVALNFARLGNGQYLEQVPYIDTDQDEVASPRSAESLGSCHWNPCLNGGQCTAKENGYKCMCKDGYIGVNCERRSNCIPTPCYHGACSSTEMGYVCTCKLGYKGMHCDVLDKCNPNPCHNNGQCAETMNEPTCSCLPGFLGALCQLESKCAPMNPCANGGSCREVGGQYQCICRDGYVGQNCETFALPTKPPVTSPYKQEGPQVIPPPANQPANELHQIFTSRQIDENGYLVTMTHEIVSPGMEGVSNPGAVLSPHSQQFGQAILKEVPTPSIPYPSGMHSFVGAPAEPDRLIIHRPDENRATKTESGSSKKKQNDANIITGEDDRYQTHFVQMHNPPSQSAPSFISLTNKENSGSSKAGSSGKVKKFFRRMEQSSKKQGEKYRS